MIENKIKFFAFNSYVLMIGFGLIMSSCKSTKYLDENQSFVDDVKIEIKDNFDKADESDLIEELDYFIRQKKNGSFIFIPKEYIYFKNADAGDTSKVNKWMREKVGETPSIYKESETDLTVKTMEQYLKFKKGYYNASVSYQNKLKNRFTSIIYQIKLGKRYKIKTVTYYTSDDAIQNTLDSIKGNSLINIGEGLDADKFEQEKARIVNHLQNSGYAEFAANYIAIKGDSSSGDFGVDVIVQTLLPANSTQHNKYKIGLVKVYTDHYLRQDTFELYYEEINGIRYYREQSTYIVNPEVLSRLISFKTGTYTKREDRLNTYSKLSNLSTYRFVEIIPEKNKLDANLIDYTIQLTPHIKRGEIDRGLDIFNSTLARTSIDSTNARLIGFGINAQLNDRNLLSGSETYILSAGVNTQIELTTSKNPIRALNYNLNNALQYPVFKDPLKFVRILNKTYLLSDNMYKGFYNDAITSLNLGLNSVSFRDLYSILSIDGNLGYRFSDKISKNILVNQLGITANKYRIDSLFAKLLKDSGNQFQLNNLTSNFFTGIFFRNLSYNFNWPRNSQKISKALLVNFETSGLEASILNGFTNFLIAKNNEWRIGSFQFSKFARLEIDGRMTKFYTGKKSLVGRINLGMIAPFGKNQFSPYQKQFSIGGPNSLRGWSQRELGPGSIIQKVSKNVIPFSQSDIKIEANLEYRFGIWWVLEGAVFVDAGNIWAIEGASVTGNFTPSFYKQIAVSTGFGLRWNFDYFIIRFDTGYKLRDPYVTVEKPAYWYKPKEILEQKLGNVLVAINYPF